MLLTWFIPPSFLVPKRLFESPLQIAGVVSGANFTTAHYWHVAWCFLLLQVSIILLEAQGTVYSVRCVEQGPKMTKS